MNINQLDYALTLLKYGNFTKSSAHLGITQPALSLQIKNLEEEIGISLFDRSKNPIEATEDGLKFLKRAQEIVIMSRDLKEYASSLKSEFKGILKVGIIPTLAPYLVPLFSRELSKEFPEMILDIKEILTDDVLTLIKRGEIDTGIISTPLEKSNLVVKPILFEKFFYYSTEKQEEVDLDKLWLLEEGNCFRDQVNDICALTNVVNKNNLIYRCSSIDSLIRMVDHHGGTTILPELTTLSLNEAQEANISPIKGKVREISIVHRSTIDKIRFIDAVQHAILKNTPSRMHKAGNNEIVDPGIKMD